MGNSDSKKATKVDGKYVYKFSEGNSEGTKEMRELLGGKGANLAEMCNLGLPVPSGFTITTEACGRFVEEGEAFLKGIGEQIKEGVRSQEETMGMKFGDASNPLLLSVRSGAAISMPGMMDTVLNLGLNDTVAAGMIKKCGNERFVWDSYRRFVDMFGNVVMGIDHGEFEKVIQAMKDKKNVKFDTDLTAADLKDLVGEFKAVYKKNVGESFPTDPETQLGKAVQAVFKSWNTPRAIRYRKINKITNLAGTAVNVQAMVYGNMGETSGTGVCFTRNPSTGQKELYGEYLLNAQGEDVVAGIRTPQPIATLEDKQPENYHKLVEYTTKLENHFRDMQDIEFTVQEGKLYMLQCRNGKRTGACAIRVATEMVKEGLVTEEDAVARLVSPEHVNQMLHPRFKSEKYRDQDRVIGHGLPASPGAAVGHIVFTAEEAEAWVEQGKKVVLVRVETASDDIGGMHVSEGILTSRGGMTSHAAVVARGWGKPCVAGCEGLVVDEEGKTIVSGSLTLKEGDMISLNGSTGEVIKGAEDLVPPELAGAFGEFMAMVEKFRTMGVRANADTPDDAKVAIDFGAEGIGLCRTEHMFFGADRVVPMREMILADDLEARQKALEKLLPMQREDFEGMFKALDGRPMTVRLLDPPLHEFVPKTAEGQEQVAKSLGLKVEVVRDRVEALKELNPMLGHRGCRLGITHPEITEMQVKALVQAACRVQKSGVKVEPEIMVPLITSVDEFNHQFDHIKAIALEVFEEEKAKMTIHVGTMIETPRAALMAGSIAEKADFFSFGTNDLTQMTFGFSRDDVGKFLPQYLDMKLLHEDPFQSIDQEGVGQLIKMATQNGRAAHNIHGKIHCGVCGEQGGDPKSVHFFNSIPMDYVSCSPLRVPVARLAAAQAALKAKKK